MSTPRILVTGAQGQLGRCLADLSENLQAKWVFASHTDLDISVRADIDAYFDRDRFDFCINTAAYTKVDLAETEQTQAFMINAEAAGWLAEACARHHCTLIHFSTDYVYDNALRRPLQEVDPVNPRSVYAKSKLAGERQALEINPKTIVLRTSWVFSEYGQNFVRTMLRLMHEGKSLRIVNDQTGCPTYAGDLANTVISVIRHLQVSPDEDVYGVYNYCNAGATNWYEFARTISSMIGVKTDILPVSTAEYDAAAARPAYSVLDTTKIQSTFGVEIPNWEYRLRLVLERIAGQKE